MSGFHQSGAKQFVIATQGQSNAAISSAMLDLNKSGLLVDEFGSLHLEGQHVSLRIRQGVPCALIDGARIEWAQFRQVLPRRPA